MSDEKPPLLENATADLAAFAAGLRYEDIPEPVVATMKRCVLDSLGCCLFGTTLPWTQRVQAMAEADGCAPVASIFGTGVKTSVANAVLVNSTAGHAFELDDIHKESILHPGSIALPIALALAEQRGGCSGRELITALVAGYELGIRVGNAATMSLFFRGFHPQGSSGVFVAAATAGRFLGLDAGRMQHALGIVGSQAGGLMAAQEGAMVKRFHAGRAAQSGVYAAVLAQSGFTGISDVLEAPYGGYLSTYSGEPNPARLTDRLGTFWETELMGYKPHASVTSIHAAQDALGGILRDEKLSAKDIAKVDVGLSRMTYVHCAWEYKAQGVTAAQMNLFYGLAVIALDGVAFVEQYRQDRLADPAILDFIERIEARIDPEIDAKGAAYRHAARLRVQTVDGRLFEREIWNRRGSPDNPLSGADIEHKFRNVVASCLASERIDAAVALVDDLDRLDSIDELLAITTSPRPA